MSYTFLSADWHLSHRSSIDYCNRPYRTEQEMNISLISNANERMRADDTLIHVGDFFFKKAGATSKAKDLESLINATVIHVNGNHDTNNTLKNHITSLQLTVSGLTILVRHRPFETFDEFYKLKDIDFVICGHVHNAWKYKIVSSEDGKDQRIMINVGCDVWNYRPVRLDEVVGFYHKIKGTFKK